VERVAFTAAYPGVATPRVWYSLSVDVHLGRLQAAVDERIAARSGQLGLAPAVSTATPFAPLRRGTTLRVVPEVDGVACNPPSQDVAWLEDLQEVSFRVRAAPEAAGRALLGAVTVHAGPLLVAQVPLLIRVRGTGEREQAAEPATAQLFSKVFASSAHEDGSVVRAFAEAYRALGIDVLVDKASLRAGSAGGRSGGTRCRCRTARASASSGQCAGSAPGHHPRRRSPTCTSPPSTWRRCPTSLAGDATAP
jgi:hypothetical protein